MANAQFLGISILEYQVLAKLYSTGSPDAIHGVNYILANGIHIVVADKPRWDRPAWFDSNTVYVVLDSRKSTLLDSPAALSNIIHEALHIEQGSALSHSVEGERLAKQAELRVYQMLDPKGYETYQKENDAALDAQNAEAYAEVLLNISWTQEYALQMLTYYPSYPGETCLNLLLCFYWLFP